MPLQRFRNHHHIMALLAATGKSNIEISTLTGVSPNRVSTIMTSPLFITEVERIRHNLQQTMIQDVVHKLQGEAEESLKTVVAIRDNPKVVPNTRLKAATTILDRIPQLSVAQRLADIGQPIQLTDAQVEFMMEALRDDPVAEEAFREAEKPIKEIDRIKAFDLVETEYDDISVPAAQTSVESCDVDDLSFSVSGVN